MRLIRDRLSVIPQLDGARRLPPVLVLDRRVVLSGRAIKTSSAPLIS